MVTEHKPEIYSFLLSFVVIANFWLGHHRVFEHVRAYTPNMMRLNLLWLLAIVILLLLLSPFIMRAWDLVRRPAS